MHKQASGRHYDAFLSYSQKADLDLATALQSGLERLGKPWNQRRALRVFRDDSVLGLNESLWSRITVALDNSDWLVVLASPAARQSIWVNREVTHWLDTKGPEAASSILLALTDGELTWNESLGCFDPNESTSLPVRLLHTIVEDEPRHLDLRWYRSLEVKERQDALDLQNARFRDSVAQIAATIRDVDKDELEGEAVREERRTVRFRNAAFLGLATLALLASLFGVQSNRNANRADAAADEALAQASIALAQEQRANTEAENARAEEQRANTEAERARTQASIARAEEQRADRESKASEARALAAEAQLLVDVDPLRAIALSTSSYTNTADPTPEAIAALIETSVAFETSMVPVTSPYPVDRELGGVQTIAFSADGRYFATGNQFLYVQIWDAETFEQVGSNFNAAVFGVNWIELSDNGRYLLTLSSSSEASLLDLDSEQPVPLSRSIGGLTGAFSPDSRTIVTGDGGGSVRMFDLDSNEATIFEEAHVDGVSALDFSPDGRLLVSGGGDGRIRIQELASGEVRYLDAHPSPMTALSFNADGSLLATADSQGSLAVWDTAVWEAAARQPEPRTEAITSLDFHPSSNLLAASHQGDVGITLWNAKTGTKIGKTLKADAVNTWEVKFSSDGRFLAAVGADGELRTWRSPVSKGIIVDIDARNSVVTSVDFATDGGSFAVGYQEGAAEIFEVDSDDIGSIVSIELSSPVIDIQFGPNDRLLLITLEDAVEIWNAATETRIGRLETERARSAHFTPDGRRVLVLTATTIGEGSVLILRAPTLETISTIEANSYGTVAFTPDGRHAIFGRIEPFSRGRCACILSIDVWDIDVPRKVFGTGEEEGHRGTVGTVLTTATGTDVVSAGVDGTLRLWDWDPGTLSISRKDSRSLGVGFIASLSLSPSGGVLGVVTGPSSFNGTLHFYNPSDGEGYGPPLRTDSPIAGIALGPDGHVVTYGYEEGDLQYWRLFDADFACRSVTTWIEAENLGSRIGSLPLSCT